MIPKAVEAGASRAGRVDAGDLSTADAAIPRVCFLMEGFYPIIHGATTQILMLGERLVSRGAGVLVVTRRIHPEHPREEVIRGIEVVRVWPPVGLHRIGKFLMLPTALWTLIRHRSRYDVLVVSDFKVLGALGVLVAALLGRPCLLRAESRGELDITEWLAENRGPHPILAALARVVAPLRRAWLRRASGFLSISSAMTEEFRKSGVAEGQIIEIPNGIDTVRFAPVRESSRKEELRLRLGLPEGRLFVYTGRLAEGKGLDWLLEVWAEVADRTPGAHLVLVGGGQGFAMDIEDRLRAFVHTNDLGHRVTFTGSVDNVQEYLKASDAFVLPSESEGLPLSLLEAMACGLPCVATAVGGVPDILEHDVNGLLVPHGDSVRLGTAVEALLGSNELAGRLGRAARQTVVNRFDVDVVARRYFGLIRQMTTERTER